MGTMTGITHTMANWPGRYQQLLADSGLNAETVLGKALESKAPQTTAVLSLNQCLNTPSLLQQQMQADYPGVTGQRSLRTYLSVTHLDLMLYAVAPLILRLFRYGQAPLPAPHRLLLGPASGGRVTSRWFHDGSGEQVGVAEFVPALAQQLNDWYPVFRHQLNVSPGAYWSTTGLALSAPFSLVWNTVSPEALCAMAQEWLAQFNCDAQRFLEWIPAGPASQQHAIPQRRGCCLKYQLPDGGYCGTCGVYRKARLAEINRPSPSSKPGQWQPEQ
jgi:hypothetical protein